MWDLVGNPEDRFSQNEAHIYFLQKLRHTESDRLSVQVHAYLDNMIDVAALLEDSETKTEALEKAAELEDELSQVGNKDAGLVGGSVQAICIPTLSSP